MTRQRLQELQRLMSQVDDQISQLRKRRSGVIVELQRITLRAAKARAQAEGAQLRLGEIKREMAQLSAKKAATAKELAALKDSLRHQVKWLYALGPLGTLSFFPASADIENYLAKGRYLEWWRNHESRKLQKAFALHSELETQEKEARDAESRYSKLSQEMASLQEELRANEQQLYEYLDGIQKDESQKRNMQAEMNEEAILLERMLASVVSKPGPAVSVSVTVSFQNLVGKLPRPVDGSLAAGFGIQTHPRFGTKTHNNGILISAKGGEPVRSVAFGRVVRAEPFQSVGLMAIIDHGGSHYTIYKHLLALTVSVGDTVGQGETIGYVGDTPDGPMLGFEVRNRAAAEDPQRWFALRYAVGR
jgi:septal ring factor EnvC (AmiA/AmiB activator)